MPETSSLTDLTPARPGADCRLRDVRVALLCPFDLDFEPDLARVTAGDASIVAIEGPGGATALEVPPSVLKRVTFGGEHVANEALVSARVYAFGTGVVRVAFTVPETDLARLAALSARAEEVVFEERAVRDLVRDVGEAIRERLRPTARAHYESLLKAVEAYPVIRVGSLPAELGLGDAFVERERRALAAIVGGDVRTGPLSEFALREYPVLNYGPLRDDVIAFREAGAFIHVSPGGRGPDGANEALADARRIEGLLELAYAQYWSLRSVDLVIQHLQDQATRLVTSVQKARGPRFSYGVVTRGLYRAREEHVAVSSIVDDFLELPAIGYDVFLDEVFRKAQETFDVPARAHTARDRLDDLERSYEVVHRLVSEQRLFVIEVLVLVVIVLEFVLPFLRLHG